MGGGCARTWTFLGEFGCIWEESGAILRLAGRLRMGALRREAAEDAQGRRWGGSRCFGEFVLGVYLWLPGRARKRGCVGTGAIQKVGA